MDKNLKIRLAEFKENLGIAVAARNHFEAVLADHDRAVGSVQAEIDTATERLAGLNEQYAAAPEKVKEFSARIVQIEAERSAVLLQPRYDKLRKILDQITELLVE